MNEDAIKLAVSSGVTCLKCEREIPRGEYCVSLTFSIKLPIVGSTSKTEFSHANCADKVAAELHIVASEARRRNG